MTAQEQWRLEAIGVTDCVEWHATAGFAEHGLNPGFALIKNDNRIFHFAPGYLLAINHQGATPDMAETAGAIAVEIEVVPEAVASEISKRVNILLWSMGAGPGCDAQYLFANDILSTGLRYTSGDVANNATVFIDEKLRFDRGVDLTVRLSASRRWLNDLDQEAYTVRQGVRLDWYITPDFLLDLEFGYEWLLQEFQSDDFQVHQGFAMMGLRRRF